MVYGAINGGSIPPGGTITRIDNSCLEYRIRFGHLILPGRVYQYINLLSIMEFLTKNFSPSYDRKKYEKMVKGFSYEFCHNVMRLIARPTCNSSNHWESECLPWLYKTIMAKVTVDRTPMNIFDEFLDDVRNLEWNDGFIEAMRLVAVNEAYGKVRNDSFSYAKEKVIELSKLIMNLSEENATLPQISKEFHSWRLSINRK